MFDGIRSFDELNQINAGKRSIDYETYFGEMEITEQDKERRISLAERFEDEFLFILSYLFTLQQYGQKIDWEDIRNRFETGYLEAIKRSVDADEYIKSYAKKFSYDVTDSTKDHESDPYYYSLDRSIWMAENEANTSLNHQGFSDALKAGKTKKKWIDIRDKKERETHRKVGGTVKEITEPFLVGNSMMMFPKDRDTFGAESKEIIGCRCSVKYF